MNNEKWASLRFWLELFGILLALAVNVVILVGKFHKA